MLKAVREVNTRGEWEKVEEGRCEEEKRREVCVR